jgi:hypothetical protein
MNTQENNKLIAEFMGYPNIANDEDKRDYLEDCLKYHKSWDWLMPVVSQCFKTGDDTYEWDNIMDTLFTCDIDIVYTQVVEFINQYNKTK